MVPRVGFEPTTLGLEVLCSIQLSYRGIFRIISFNKNETKMHKRTCAFWYGANDGN